MPIKEGSGQVSTSKLNAKFLFDLTGLVACVTGGGTGMSVSNLYVSPTHHVSNITVVS